MFDPDQFMSGTVEGEMSTEFTPVPEGEYNALITGVNARSTSSDKGEYVILDVTWAIDDAAVAAEVGMDNPTVRQSIFLDTTDGGGLDFAKGKNIQLGRLRDAVKQNGPSAWSPSMLEGQVAKVRVAHRMYEGRIFADVKGVSAVG
jgi:hypothetical protein